MVERGTSENHRIAAIKKECTPAGVLGTVAPVPSPPPGHHVVLLSDPVVALVPRSIDRLHSMTPPASQTTRHTHSHRLRMSHIFTRHTHNQRLRMSHIFTRHTHSHRLRMSHIFTSCVSVM